jgi:glycerate-2-kinase
MKTLIFPHAQQLRVGLDDLVETRGKFWIFGAGKAAPAMAKMLEETAVGPLGRGVVIGRDLVALAHTDCCLGNHPFPLGQSLASTRLLMDRLQQVPGEDHVLFCLSGGASSLMEYPRSPLTPEDLLFAHRAFLASGLPIEQINALRRRLSAVKGGGLLSCCQAELSVFVLSDVIGDPLEVIGSGPFFPSADRVAWESLEQLSALGLLSDASPELKRCLGHPQPGAAKHGRAHPPRHRLMAHNGMALQTLRQLAVDSGYTVTRCRRDLAGEARELGASLMREALATLQPGELWLFGGETTVTLRGNGLGGRNQEWVLAALTAGLTHPLADELVLLSAGTDGIDGPTDAAGAWLHRGVLAEVRSRGLDPDAYLDRNDAYTFFNTLGTGHLMLGPTGTNVMDLMMIARRRH